MDAFVWVQISRAGALSSVRTEYVIDHKARSACLIFGFLGQF